MASPNLEVKNSVELCVLRFVKEFQSSPFKFLYESDIQAILFSLIREKLPGTLAVKGTGHPLDFYDVSIVHTEYANKIDISCLDVERTSSTEARLHKGSDIHIYNLPVLIGIEIKYRKIGDKFGVASCLNDLEKLTRLDVPYPIVLGFVQSEQDVEQFLLVDHLGFSAVEVDITSPIEKINIISPTRRWRIVKNS